MKTFPWLPAVVFVLFAIFPPEGGAASKTDSKEGQEKRLLQRVLQLELQGQSFDRAQRLNLLLQRNSDFAPAYWQSGYVRLENQWIPFDEVPAYYSRNALLAEYRRLRATTAETAEGHWKLGQWCRRHQLAERSRAHFTAVLERNPNHLQARKALGFTRIGPYWISKTDSERNRQKARQLARDFQRWRPRIESLLRGLTSGSTGRYQKAVQQLQAIHNPEAIPIIEWMLGYHNPQLALVVIDYLDRQPSQAATLSLTRLAMASEWPTIRKTAAEKLKTRKPEHFVPQVLSLTSTPIQSRRQLYVNRFGELFYTHLAYWETQKMKRANISRTEHSAWLLPISLVGAHLDRPPIRRSSAIPLRTPITQRRDLEKSQAVREQQIRESLTISHLNDLIQKRNQRVCHLISIIADRPLCGDPKALWKWWDQYIEVYNPENKPVLVVWKKLHIVHVTPVITTCSCLVAGTPVWTDRGPVAIEKIRIGDLVLSKDARTGELAYKPVLKTTIRPRTPLLQLQIGGRTVSLTGGHPFWITGKGWTKARDIEAGMTMHDVRGVTEVRPVGLAKPQKTYNLIVADFHTYFVSEAKVLSHDNTPIEPVDALVPGLPLSQ